MIHRLLFWYLLVVASCTDLTQKTTVHGSSQMIVTDANKLDQTTVVTTEIPQNSTTIATGLKNSSNKNSVVSHKKEDLLCINNFGQCVLLDKHECPDHRALLDGLCAGSESRKCCVPDQSEIKLWDGGDEKCVSEFGQCQLDTKNCSGKYTNAKCGGPLQRRCCTPSPKDVLDWENHDKSCKLSLGKCQLDSLECKGEYQKGICGGPEQRQCCLPSKDIKAQWQKHDKKCLDKWGTCTANQEQCAGGKYKNLCGGPEERQCCMPDKETISSWGEKDKQCKKQFGICQRSADNCTGHQDASKCDGPAYRQCCSPDKSTVEDWAKDDALCKAHGGICQSIVVPCNQKFVEGFCGGPATMRQCCLSPIKSTVTPDREEDPNSDFQTTMMRMISNNLILFISIAVSLLILVICLYCVIKKRTKCCNPYLKLRGDHRKTPWYKMGYTDMEEEEELNLTVTDDEKTYA